MVFSKENVGQINAINNVWSRSKADLLGKLDNDCLVTVGWTRILEQAHHDIPELGVVACWPFSLGEFDYERAKHKIQKYGRHQILRHPWTCGTGLLVKRDTYQKLGPIQGRANSTTQYWLKMAMAGYVNGFYYPLIYQEHMDDPKHRLCRLRSTGQPTQFKDLSATLQIHRLGSIRELLAWSEIILSDILDGPYEPSHYLGWRGRIRSLRNRVLVKRAKVVGALKAFCSMTRHKFL